jgi:hypothetical protein
VGASLICVKPLAHMTGWITGDDREIPYVACYHRTCRHDGALTDPNAAKDDRPSAYPHVVADKYLVGGFPLSVSHPRRKCHRAAHFIRRVIIPANDLNVSSNQAVVPDVAVYFD